MTAARDSRRPLTESLTAGRPPDCAVCGDARVISAAAPRFAADFGKALPCPACVTGAERARMTAARHRSGMWHAMFDDYTLDRLDAVYTQEPRTAVNEYIERWLHGQGGAVGHMLVLTGDRGTGKTHGAVAAAHEWLAAGRTVHVSETASLLAAVRATYDRRRAPNGDDSPSEEDVIGPALRADLTVLDDFGTEKASEWTEEKLYRLINDRWAGLRPTIVTTNITPATAPADSRVWSRLLGDRFATVITTGGPDRRRHTAGQRSR